MFLLHQEDIHILFIPIPEGICLEPATPANGMKLNEGNKYGDVREFR
jgi:hypothetical protein